MRKIKRVMNFGKQDWKHVGWLLKNMVKQALIGEFGEAKDAWMWVKVHLSYDSTRIG